MENRKYTGVIEKEELSLPKSEYQYRKTEINECPCKKIHILKFSYKETPYPKDKVKYKCPVNKKEYALDNVHERWTTKIEEHEKAIVVDAEIVKDEIKKPID